jgi:1,4-dihydroxy-6-naphthoate synthase
MDESVMRQHIDLYVNDYSLDLGRDGKKAVQQFLKVYCRMEKKSLDDSAVFLEDVYDK